MTQINTYHELHFRGKERFLSELRAIESEVRASVTRMSGQSVRIPVNASPATTPSGAGGGGAGVNVTALNSAATALSTSAAQLAAAAQALQAAALNLSSARLTGGAGAGGGGFPLPTRLPGGYGGGYGGGAGGIPVGIGGLYGALAFTGIVAAQNFATEYEYGRPDRSPDLMNQVQRARAETESMHSGLRGAKNWLYGKLGITDTYQQRTEMLDAAEQEERRSVARVGTMQQRAQTNREIRLSTRNLAEDAGAIGGGRMAQRGNEISQALREHNEAAQHIEDAWQQLGFRTYQQAQTTANRIRSAGQRIALWQTYEATLADQRAQGTSNLNIAATNEAGAQAGMRAAGLGRMAAVRGRLFEIDQRISQKSLQVLTTADPVERARLMNELRAETAAAIPERQTVQADESRRRQAESYQSANIVRQQQEAAQEAAMVAGNRPRAAAMARRIHQADQMVREAQQAFELETDPAAKAQRAAELQATIERARNEKAAAGAEERKRIEDEVAEYTIGVMRAQASLASRDYQQQTKVLEAEWDRRIKKIEDVGEKEAALRQKAAEVAAVAERRQREIDETKADTRSTMVRAGGQGALADVMDLWMNTQRRLREAGGDEQMKSAIRANAQAQMQMMASQMVRPGQFGRYADYLRGVQSEAFSGRGAALDMLQKLFPTLGPGHSGADADEAFKTGTELLNQAADKIINSGALYILKDSN